MKRFVISILFVSVFCIGLGALVDKVGAKFKSDEKALAIIRDARQAIGGDSAIAAVRSMTITGQTTRTIKADGADRTDQGETEIALQFPDKMMKMVSFGKHDGDQGTGERVFDKQVDVVVVGTAKEGDKNAHFGTGNGTGNGSGKSEGYSTASDAGAQRIVIKKADGTTEVRSVAEAGKLGEPSGDGIIIQKMDRSGNAVFTSEGGKTIVTDGPRIMLNRIGGEGHHDEMRHNDLLRMTLSLLLTAPEGMDVSYTFGGEHDVDGVACNMVVADFAGSSYKIYIAKSTNLPVMMSYNSIKPQVVLFRTKSPAGGEDTKENLVFTRKVDGPPIEPVEFNVKFSDYRSVGGVQLPYKWTQTVGGAPDEVFDVTGYELNPANIADKFNNQNVKFRVQSDQQ